MDDRRHVLPEDIQAVLPAVVTHRLSPSGETAGSGSNALVAQLLEEVAIP
jgi:MoxR-like ATPase